MKNRMMITLIGIMLLTPMAVAQSKFGVFLDDHIAAGEKGRAMEDYLRKLEAFDFHGSVLVAEKGTVLLHAAFGLANPQTGICNHTSTVFSTGSVTKQFTAAGIMLLVQDLVITVDDPIDRFFNGVPPDKANITVHQLLTHTSGLPAWVGMDDDPISRDDLIALVMQTPLDFSPGEQYQYSNVGYSLLAAIIEIVADEPLELYLKRHFFLPDWMRNTGLWEPLWVDSLVSHSHNAQLGYPACTDRPRDAWNLIGNGGIVSTVSDMYRWHLSLHGDDHFTAATKAMMFAPHVKEYEEGNSYYGYGWVVQESRTGDTVIWHNGGAMPHGWSCADYYYKGADAVFIVFSNKPVEGQMPADAIVANLSSILFGDREVINPPEVVDLSEAQLQPLVGHYALENGARLVAESGRSGQLQLRPIGQEAVDALFPSPMAARLPKYNDKTTEMIDLMAGGQFAEAAAMWDISPGDDGEAMMRLWWHSFDSLGKFDRIEIVGTKAGDGAHTYFNLDFEHGTAAAEAAWGPAGRCLGIMEGEPLTKTVYPESPTRFNGFSLYEGALSVVFEDNDMTITLPSRQIVRATHQ
ncbi:MAG: serine hydrolase domain-containing protein [bacterium]